MNLTLKQYQVLYAISMLKAPLSSSIWALCGAERKETQHRLRALTDKGLIDPKPYGAQRLMYMLSLAGGAALSEYLAKNEKPVLCEIGAPTTNARSSGKKFVKREPLDGAATPRCVSVMLGVYEPAKDRAYYRNDGNKHIKSLGAF